MIRIKRSILLLVILSGSLAYGQVDPNDWGVMVLSDNFNITSSPNVDQNIELSSRQTGTASPSLWEDIGTGDTQPGGLFEDKVIINGTNQLETIVQNLNPDPTDPNRIVLPAQLNLTQMPRYRLRWDQGVSAIESSWSLMRFNVDSTTFATSSGLPDCGIMVWTTGQIIFWVDGEWGGQGDFSTSGTGENGLHHFEIDVNDGIINVYVDDTISSGNPPTWTANISQVGTGTSGVGVVSLWNNFGVGYDTHGYFDNFFYQILPPANCGDVGTQFLVGDLSGPGGVPDCYVDINDLSFFTSEWLDCTDPEISGCFHWWE